MREVDAAASDLGPPPAALGKCVGRWQAGARSRDRPHIDLSGTGIVSVADGGWECGVRHENEEHSESRAPGEGAALLAAGTPGEVRGQLYPPAFGRDAATCGTGASLGC